MAQSSHVGRHRSRTRRRLPLPLTGLLMSVLLVVLVIGAGVASVWFAVPDPVVEVAR